MTIVNKSTDFNLVNDPGGDQEMIEPGISGAKNNVINNVILLCVRPAFKRS